VAFAKVFLKNPRTGQMREAPVGFSWTVFFFGFFPPLLRGDWAIGAVMFLTAMILFWIFLPFLPALIMSFIYNKMYIRRMINEGFEVTGGTTDLEIIERKVGFTLPRLSA